MPAGFAGGKGNIYNPPVGNGSGSRPGGAGGKMCKVGKKKLRRASREPSGSGLRNPEPDGSRLATETEMSQVTAWAIGVSVVVAAGVGVPMWWHASHSAAAAPETPLPVMTEPAEPADPPKKTEFATGNDAPKGAEIKFDAERSLKYVKLLCDLGPRVSGTEAMKKQQLLLEKHFKDLGATVTRQEFKARQASRRAETEMTNLVISWHPDKARRVILCSHYDTRPIADQERERGNWNKPFVSANDGTSGAAMMMELAHHMKDLKTEVGVDFVLFDGEEYIFETQATGGNDRYFIGSEYFAEDYAKTKNTRKHQYAAAVLMDLCHAKDAKLRVEQYSYTAAPELVDQIWTLAGKLGAKSFRYERGYEVQDDHLALNRVGIPAVDLIDFDYPHWHKLTDTADKVSGDQMAEVAKVMAAWFTRIK